MAKRQMAGYAAWLFLGALVLLGLPAWAMTAFMRTSTYCEDMDPCGITSLPGSQAMLSAVLQGESEGTCPVSPSGVRYGSGHNLLSEPELASGSASGWSQVRSLAPEGFSGVDMGAAWRNGGHMSLTFTLGMVRVESGAGAARIFTDNGNGTYSPISFYKETLVLDAPNGKYLLTDTRGARWEFHNGAFGPSGKLWRFQDPGGNLTSLTYGTSGVTTGGLRRSNRFNVTMRRRVEAGETRPPPRPNPRARRARGPMG